MCRDVPDETRSHHALVAQPRPDPTEPRAPRAWLLIEHGDELTSAVVRAGAAAVVGRGADADVSLPQAVSLSRRHARFEWREGALQVRDLSSKNGVFVDGRRVPEASLHGDEDVRLGEIPVSVRIVGGPAGFSSGRPAPAAAESGAHDLPTVVPPVLYDRRMRQLYEMVGRVARTTMPVLILGETGVGKELVAHAVHDASPRRESPFEAINCGAIPATLLQSTLFGHQKGAFTGASRDHAGLFERADGGTVFLDEVGELSDDAQVALLRVLETSTVSRIGSNEPIKVDIRVVAATHRDLEERIGRGQFRSDLWYRLEAVTLEVPPLRDRPSEIGPLAQYFLERAKQQWGASASGFTEAALQALGQYDWPGNVRQLRNTVERACAVSQGQQVEVSDLPPAVSAGGSVRRSGGASLTDRVRAFEAALLREALHETGGNQTHAAELLGIPRKTLSYRIKTLGI